MFSIPFLRCGGVEAAAARLPGRPIGRPYNQTIKRQFPPAGSRPRPTGTRKFFVAGVRAHPNQRWRIGKTDGKTVFPGVFPGFFDSTSPLGVLGVCNPQAVPRASEVAAAFSVFLPAGPCPAIAPTEQSAMQKPTRSVGSPVQGPGTGAIRRGTL